MELLVRSKASELTLVINILRRQVIGRKNIRLAVVSWPDLDEIELCMGRSSERHLDLGILTVSGAITDTVFGLVFDIIEFCYDIPL